MKVVAHRGFSGKYPENTMLAFEKAVEAGCDEIEFDIQLTKDKVIVIFHDESVDRITDGAGYIRDYTFDELRKLNIIASFGDQHGFNTIPSLEEYLSWVKDENITTNIELKTGKYYYKEIEEKTVAMVKEYQLEDRVIFSSFNYLSLVCCKELAPNIKCGVLGFKGGLGNAGYYVKKYNFEFYHPGIDDVTDELVEDCKAHGIELNVWTVNDEEDVKKLYDWGCRGVITDYPDRCKQWIESRRLYAR